MSQLQQLQSAATSVHQAATYLGNNLSSPISNEEFKTLIHYDQQLDALESQISDKHKYPDDQLWDIVDQYFNY